MYERLAGSRVREALQDTPVVLIVGPRRAGKTTLVRKLGGHDRTYVTLDDRTALDAATSDPAGFIRGLGPATIDEVQRAPELLLAIKKSVDEEYRAGRFLLTGSANILTVPRVADSLAGRMETIGLLPLAQAEIMGCEPTVLDDLFAARIRRQTGAPLAGDLVRRVLRGGFPEAVGRDSERRRQSWSRSYLTSVLTRDLRDIAEVERLTELPKFVRLLAEHSGQLVNFSQLGAGIGVSHKTAQRYVGLLEQLFLVAPLRPWFTNALKRLVKTPKLHFVDTGLLSTLRGISLERATTDRTLFGHVLETFVYTEILKLSAASDMPVSPYHVRDRDGREVDIVLERADGMIVGIEVKASATVRARDFEGLRALAEASGDRFAFGAVLYDSTDIVPFGDRLAAVPVSSLWAGSPIAPS